MQQQVHVVLLPPSPCMGPWHLETWTRQTKGMRGVTMKGIGTRTQGETSKWKRDRDHPAHRHTKSVEMPVPTRKRMMQDRMPSMRRGIQAYVPIHAAAFLPIAD